MICHAYSSRRIFVLKVIFFLLLYWVDYGSNYWKIMGFNFSDPCTPFWGPFSPYTLAIMFTNVWNTHWRNGHRCRCCFPNCRIRGDRQLKHQPKKKQPVQTPLSIGLFLAIHYRVRDMTLSITYQGILNQQVENEKPQHIPKSWLLYFRESTNA